MKALVGAFNQEKALVGAFSVIVQPNVEPMDRFAALHSPAPLQETRLRPAEEVTTLHCGQQAGHKRINPRVEHGTFKLPFCLSLQIFLKVWLGLLWLRPPPKKRVAIAMPPLMSVSAHAQTSRDRPQCTVVT